jgi:hypothetical protein
MSERPEIEIAIRNVFREPPIMAGEKLADYRTLMKLIVNETKPQGLHEMLLARDIVDAEWEHRRLRRIKSDIVNAAIPRVVKSLMAEAGEDVALDAKLVPKIRKHVNGMLAGDARARDALEALLKDQHLTADIITAAAFADTIVPQLHADRMSTAAYERRSSAYAALDRLRQLEQKPSTPPAQAAADDIVDIDDDKHPIAPVDAGQAGQRGDVAPDPSKGR